MQKAIIYTRVSSQRQVDEGHGTDSQKHRNLQYAQNKEYPFAKWFKDEAVSGAAADRPGFNALLQFIDGHPEEEYVVIVDDISRLARDMMVHLELRKKLRERRVTIESPNFSFDDTPEGELVENVSAAVSQYDRQKNRRQVIQKQKARFEQGYWPLYYPPGLINIKHPLHGKLLTPHEPFASIFKEAIENFRDGHLNTLEQVKDFINGKYKEQGIVKRISSNGAHKVLMNVLYAGWIEYKPWGIPLTKAQHEGFITKETFDTVQEKIRQKSKASARKDYNEDFPLRGFVLCVDCKKPMTASWATGRRGGKYPHYWCKQKGCLLRWKTIQKQAMENEFEGLINSLTPNRDVVKLSKAILDDIWLNKDKEEDKNKKLIMQEINELETKKKQFMDRIVNTPSDALVLEYEKEVEKIIQQKRELEEALPTKMYSQDKFGTALEIVMQYLENPVRMWQSENYKDKRLLLEMYFDEKLAYDRKEGFGTASLAPIVKLLTAKEASENNLVEMEGVEPSSKETALQMFVVRDKSDS